MQFRESRLLFTEPREFVQRKSLPVRSNFGKFNRSPGRKLDLIGIAIAIYAVIAVCAFGLFRKTGRIRKVYRLYQSIKRGKRFRLGCLMEREIRERLPMPLHRLICLTAVLMFSAVGCCHTQCVSSDPCNPCGPGACGGGCCLTNWLHNRFACHSCRNYSWSSDCCSVCGGTSCGMNGMDGGTVMGGGGASCGCGQSGGQSSGYAPASPSYVAPTDQSPTPVPSSPASPTPTRTNEPIPAPGATDSTTFQAPANGQIQHVSVEEFHRLPGTVISGPGAVPTLTPPPALSTVSVPPRPGNPVQQAQWVPASPR